VELNKQLTKIGTEERPELASLGSTWALLHGLYSFDWFLGDGLLLLSFLYYRSFMLFSDCQSGQWNVIVLDLFLKHLKQSVERAGRNRCNMDITYICKISPSLGRQINFFCDPKKQSLTLNSFKACVYLCVCV
jgi:hypothetical protein